jgi:hypothetical protein
MGFSKNFIDGHLKSNIFPYYNNNISLSKKVKSLRQLTRIEKELVRLNYKESVILCLTIEDTQKYIAFKTKIWLEKSCLDFLMESEKQENMDWFYTLAKDHLEYIQLHKRAMDELELMKKRMWQIIINPECKPSTMILAIEELHALIKTHVLLIRDLPFVVNLPGYFDKGKIFAIGLHCYGYRMGLPDR